MKCLWEHEDLSWDSGAGIVIHSSNPGAGRQAGGFLGLPEQPAQLKWELQVQQENLSRNTRRRSN